MVSVSGPKLAIWTTCHFLKQETLSVLVSHRYGVDGEFNKLPAFVTSELKPIICISMSETLSLSLTDNTALEILVINVAHG